MEAINSLASTAAKTIWGEDNKKQNEEPVSGKQGDVSKGEPYDAGNMEPTETPNDTTSSTKTDGPNPAGDQDSSTMKGDSTKAQNDTRSPQEEEAGATISPEDLKGPGPRPVAEVAKEHGGDAGAVSRETGKGCGMLDGSDVPATKPTENGTGTGDENAEKTEGTGAEAETKDHHKEEEEEEDDDGEGTGEKYVKSSGLHADGGDFDASQPGAGREAERLLEEKGIHHVPSKKPEPAAEATTNGKSHASPEPTSPEQKEKKSLGDRIKAKLHHKSGNS